MPVKIFFCYAHEDELLLIQLMKHLKPLLLLGWIEAWHDREINAGSKWEEEIDIHLNEANIILLLISSDFMASDYCYGIEMRKAIERYESGMAHVIPVILRHALWQETPLGKFQALPSNAKPVLDRFWHNPDEAFYDIAIGVRNLIKKLAPIEENLLIKHTEALKEKVGQLQTSDSLQKIKQEIVYKFHEEVVELNRTIKLMAIEVEKNDQSNENQNNAVIPKTFQEMYEWYSALGNRERCFVQATAVLRSVPVREVSKAVNELYKPIQEAGENPYYVLFARTFTTIRRISGVDYLYWQDANIDGLSFFGTRVLIFIAHETARMPEPAFLDQIGQWPRKLETESSLKSAKSLGGIWWFLDTSHFWKIVDEWVESKEPENWRYVVNLLIGAYEAVSIIEERGEQEASRSQVLEQARLWAGEAS